MKPEKIRIAGIKLFPHEVVSLIADDNYTHIILANGKRHYVAITLKALEQRFEQQGFFRIHRSYLVNLDFVQHYTPNHRGGFVHLSNHQCFSVARRRNKLLVSVLSSIAV